MNRSLLFKLGTIALLILLLMIPLLLIDGLVNERQGARDDVLRDIARSSSYAPVSYTHLTLPTTPYV